MNMLFLDRVRRVAVPVVVYYWDFEIGRRTKRGMKLDVVTVSKQLWIGLFNDGKPTAAVEMKNPPLPT